MKFTLDFPPMQTGQKVQQVKAYFSAAEIPTTHSTRLWKTQRAADWARSSPEQVKEMSQYKYAS